MEKRIFKIIDTINEKVVKRNKLVEEKNLKLENLLKEKMSFEESKAIKLLETDFKSLYKKDNDDIRTSFIRKECKTNIENVDKIEMEIEQLKNKIIQVDIEIKVYRDILKSLTDLYVGEN